MLKNYLKIALRNILQQRLYSALNVFGLALGVGCTLLIFLFVQHELSYDRFLPASDRIFRIVERQPGNVFLGNDRFAVTPALLASEMKTAFPEVSAATTFVRASVLFFYDEETFYEQGIWADSNFFDVLAFPLALGNAATVLDEPGNMLLTQSMAAKIFGEENPIGQTLTLTQWGDTYTFSVGGVIEDLPEKSHLTFDFILPLKANASYNQNLSRRTNNSYFTYLKLAQGADANGLRGKLPAFTSDFFGSEGAKKYEFILQAMTDVHLRGNVNFDLGVPGDMKLVYLFGTIGLLILLLACVNYMNLAVARSMKRAQEVGLRQVIGARRLQIAGQFMCESVLIAFLALGLSLVFVQLSVSVFGELVDRPLVMDWGHPLLLPGLIFLVLVVGVISGSYPAFFMAQIQPAQVLKGGTVEGRSRSGLQRTLIVLQYTVSIALIAGSLVVYQQLQYILQKEVGYRRDHIVAMPLTGSDVQGREGTMIEEMRRLPGVVNVTGVSHLPTNIRSSQGFDSWDGSVEGQEVSVYQENVGYEFFNLFDIGIAAGRPFSPDVAGDTSGAIVINETAARALGWSLDEAIGKRIEDRYEVIGVMKDFHLHSMHLPIAPLMLSMTDRWYGYIVARVRPDQLSTAVVSLEGVLSRFTRYPVSHTFLDDEFRNLYEADIKLGRTIGYFAFLAVLIATIGLFGLAAYATERRTKEIGVRKVLGASIPGLLSLLSREFLLLVFIAIVFALPAAFLFAQRWLENFAYRVELSAGVFLLTALSAIVIAVLAVSYQAIRAASLDPVNALRYE